MIDYNEVKTEDMPLYDEFKCAFYDSINRIDPMTGLKENRNADGSVNWNYVEADLWMDGVMTKKNYAALTKTFSFLATAFDKNNGYGE